MRFSFLLLLLLSVSISISISPVTCDTHICPQGGQPPVECPLENQHHWDNVACRWVCNSPVQCLVDPCDDAVRDGICSRAGCKADYSFGCNFKCSKCLKSICDTARCASGTECVQDEQCHAQCKPTSTSTPTGVQCLINPCENAARDGICPLKSCVADYSKGCHFKCSKCSLTCATVKCAGGTECVQDEECNIECRPLILPTPTPTPSCLKVCRANCIKGFSCQTDSNGCKKCLPTPTPTPTGVQCLVDPCDAAVRDGICSRAGCTADYSTGCNFKCSKCLKSTCDTARCQGGYKCVQDQQCNAICKRV